MQISVPHRKLCWNKLKGGFCTYHDNVLAWINVSFRPRSWFAFTDIFTGASSSGYWSRCHVLPSNEAKLPTRQLRDNWGDALHSINRGASSVNVSDGKAWEGDDDARRAPHDSTGKNQTHRHFRSRFYALFFGTCILFYVLKRIETRTISSCCAMQWFRALAIRVMCELATTGGQVY